jgi:hypothetical protein
MPSPVVINVYEDAFYSNRSYPRYPNLAEITTTSIDRSSFKDLPLDFCLKRQFHEIWDFLTVVHRKSIVSKPTADIFKNFYVVSSLSYSI